jgi:adenylate kinase family enzyme
VRRVLILGCPASGKSTLARRLAELTGLPLVHLDRLYWRAKWIEASQTEFRAQLDAELAKSAWIIDGNYGTTVALRLAYADTAILLDFPRGRCLCRAIEQSIVEYGRPRPDMADGCREKLDPAFLHFIWRFHKHYRPKLLSELDRFAGEKIALRNCRDVEALLGDLRAKLGAHQ